MSKGFYDEPSFFKKYPQEKQKFLKRKMKQQLLNKQAKNVQKSVDKYNQDNSSFDKFVPTKRKDSVRLQNNPLLSLVNQFHPHKVLFPNNAGLEPLEATNATATKTHINNNNNAIATSYASVNESSHNSSLSIAHSAQISTPKQSNVDIAAIQSEAFSSAAMSANASAQSTEQMWYSQIKSEEKQLLQTKYRQLIRNNKPQASNVVKVVPSANSHPTATESSALTPVDTDLATKKEAIYRDTTNYSFPSSASLVRPVHKDDKELRHWILEKAHVLNEALNAYHVNAKVSDWTNGPTVTQFQVKVHLGVKVEKIRHLANDLKMALAAKTIRIQAPIPGQTTCGVEIPNPKPRPVMLSEVLDSKAFRQAKSPLTIALGVDLEGKPRVTDLRKMPHGLIAGATGSGKSVFINCMLISLLYKATPRQLRLILIDPKAVELAPYNGIPHLITPVISKPKQATAALHWCVKVMNNRYRVLEKAHVRNIEQYNQKMDKIGQPQKKMPYIVIVIDELADLMMVASNAVETYIVRITQKARAAGLHLIVATQRPSVDIVTGTIKNNIPTRIAFMVSSQVDSRTIIDTGGAERLLGKGDMLYLGNGNAHPIRLQGCFVGTKEIDKIVKQVKSQAHAHYDFQPKLLSKKVSALKHQDKLLPKVLAYLSNESTISTSKLQRVFSIGYNRSAKIIDSLQKHGYISAQDGSKPRKVLFSHKDYQQLKLKLK